METTKKYLVKVYGIETRNGKGVLDALYNGDQEPLTTLTFDTREEAEAEFNSINVGVKKMSGYYLHVYKEIEWAVYDEEGYWVDGDGIDSGFEELED